MSEIVLDHGTGAKLSGDLVKLIADTLGEAYLGEMEDSAILNLEDNRIAMTTDSFVVTPLFFSNGNVGKISVCGTVNDLAVIGATPKYLTLGLILEVGFKIDELVKILKSIRKTALEANVKIVAGDTKVVNKGEVDKIFINTAGVGVFNREPLRMKNVEEGDKIILSGYIGNHSIHLLSLREGLGFERNIQSDCAPLNGMIEDLLNSDVNSAVHSIRDVTRGGLSAVLHEFSNVLGKEIVFERKKLPCLPEAIMAADMLGIDLINLANEGCICLFVSADKSDEVLKVLRSNKYGKNATIIGQVRKSEKSAVIEIVDGHEKILEELVGAELPRLC